MLNNIGLTLYIDSYKKTETILCIIKYKYEYYIIPINTVYDPCGEPESSPICQQSPSRSATLGWESREESIAEFVAEPSISQSEK